uniref:Uncharacterized protein n=1 Tax=Anas platyrhynchos platyrhynchos TaxID=8840 RepID=A0A493TWH0_ANAPP
MSGGERPQSRAIFGGCRCSLQNQKEQLALLKAGVCICWEQEFCLVGRCSLVCRKLNSPL